MLTDRLITAIIPTMSAAMPELVAMVALLSCFQVPPYAFLLISRNFCESHFST